MDLISLLVINPDLTQERSKPRAGGIAPAIRPVASVLFLTTVAFAAIDTGRLHCAYPFSKPAQIGAFVVLIAANVLQIWAMASNPFFSTALRLQTDRGHHLVSHGPYRFVRHPGYLAMLFMVPFTALALGSTLALIPHQFMGRLFYFAPHVRTDSSSTTCRLRALRRKGSLPADSGCLVKEGKRLWSARFASQQT